MSKICYQKATSESTRTAPTFARTTSYRPTIVTVPPRLSPVRYTSSCVITIGCSDKLATSYITAPGQVMTNQVPVATLTLYDSATYVYPMYTTSCTVYTGAIPTTITDPTVAVPDSLASQADSSQSLSVWTIVGAVIGSSGGAVLIGLLIYFLCVRKKPATAKRKPAPTPPLSMYQITPLSLDAAQPHLGQPLQPYTNSEAYMRPLDRAPYTQSTLVVQRNSSQSGQNTHSDQGIRSLDEGPSLSAPAIPSRRTMGASHSRPQQTTANTAAALYPAAAASMMGHTLGTTSQSISDNTSSRPLSGSDLHSLPTFDPRSGLA